MSQIASLDNVLSYPDKTLWEQRCSFMARALRLPLRERDRIVLMALVLCMDESCLVRLDRMFDLHTFTGLVQEDIYSAVGALRMLGIVITEGRSWTIVGLGKGGAA
jgi:hypothetical protein